MFITARPWMLISASWLFQKRSEMIWTLLYKWYFHTFSILQSETQNWGSSQQYNSNNLTLEYKHVWGVIRKTGTYRRQVKDGTLSIYRLHRDDVFSPWRLQKLYSEPFLSTYEKLIQRMANSLTKRLKFLFTVKAHVPFEISRNRNACLRRKVLCGNDNTFIWLLCKETVLESSSIRIINE